MSVRWRNHGGCRQRFRGFLGLLLLDIETCGDSSLSQFGVQVLFGLRRVGLRLRHDFLVLRGSIRLGVELLLLGIRLEFHLLEENGIVVRHLLLLQLCLGVDLLDGEVAL